MCRTKHGCVMASVPDGSRLTELRFPTPNLFCGQHNPHAPLEWVAVQDMESAVTACTYLAELSESKS